MKPVASAGVCTISSLSNGQRQDWVVCPYRALDLGMWSDVASRLFDASAESLFIVPGPQLALLPVQDAILDALRSGRRALVFMQDKLGGEIAVSKTDRSPEFAFDVTIAELLLLDGAVQVGQYGILEIHTMDFHGSYRAVVNNLKDALRLHGDGFHAALAENDRWLSERIEGPNIANVFKRTFYQIMLKFQVGAQASCAGCVLAIPQSVWDSWQRHLGAPVITRGASGMQEMLAPGRTHDGGVPAWIYVFDIDATGTSPNELRTTQVIATDAESVAYYALKVAPEAAVGFGGTVDRIPATIALRLRTWWDAIERPSLRTRG